MWCLVDRSSRVVLATFAWSAEATEAAWLEPDWHSAKILRDETHTAKVGDVFPAQSWEVQS
jgi:hypothetical protein